VDYEKPNDQQVANAAPHSNLILHSKPDHSRGFFSTKNFRNKKDVLFNKKEDSQ
jgi:hypothetical protein